MHQQSNLPLPAAMPPEAECWQAFTTRDKSYSGLFVTAVKTTGIFCRVDCPARPPLRKHVEFFHNNAGALKAGYRPCRMCRPLESGAPGWVSRLLQAAAGSEKLLTSADLIEQNLQPATVRRWFKKHFGPSFSQVIKQVRLDATLDGLHNHRQPVTWQAFESGYESLSTFNRSSRRYTGHSPSNTTAGGWLKCGRMATPLGSMLAAFRQNSLVALLFEDTGGPEALDRQAERLKLPLLYSAAEVLQKLQHELDEYFAGRLKHFSLPVEMSGTAFQKECWQALLQIPPGTTVSYARQAEMIGRPAAVRAVARANALNPVTIIVPCHRVVGKDGRLSGYGGGLWRKRALLELESAQPQ